MNLPDKHKIILDYILSQVEYDQRPYLEVTVFNTKMLGLLDSGASRTIVGIPGWKILEELGLKLNKTDMLSCTVANGASCQCIGSVTAPIRLMDKIKLIDILIVPDLQHTLILGLDFWKTMEIIPNLHRNEWKFDVGAINSSTADFVISKSELSPDQQRILDKFVQEKFELMKTSLGCTHLVEHEIITDSPPIKQRYYPVSPMVQKHIDEELQKMLDLGVIQKSNSSWSSPIILVPKKEGGYRFCVDFRKLNGVTKKDAYPLPYVSAILDRLKGAKYLSSLDIKTAYWQVPMKETSKEYTAFTIPGRGLYQFTRMPFGLCNAPAVWQRLMDKVIGADLEPYAFVYLDDIIVISSSFEDHINILDQIFTRLYNAGLTVSKDKCHFCKPELKYLGYIIDKKGLRVDPEKVQAILSIPTPSNIREVRCFMGMASWYRRFVPHFSTVIAPLCHLLKKSSKWHWTPQCDEAFNTIKEYLISAPILHCPDFTKPFVVQTDASAYGLGAVLSQEFPEGERVICYLSRSLTKSERQYSTTERECLGVLWALEKLRPYIEGAEFTVVTDHHSLVWLNNLKDPCGRLCRWAVRLQQYNFKVVHRKGKEHLVPDFLSRSVPVTDSITVNHNRLFEDFEGEHVKDRWYCRLRRRIEENPATFAQWRIEDNKIYKYVKHKFPDLVSESDQWKLVVPKESRLSLLKDCHSRPTSAHPGILKTYQKLSQKYFWPKMQADVVRFVKNCEVCIAHKVVQNKPSGFMGSRPVVSKPFQMISVDIVGPLPRSTKGYVYIFVVCDYFSKFVLTCPLRTATTASICKFLEDHVFLLFGVPQYIISDNGPQFKSADFKKLCEKYDSTVLYNALYHPQNNPTERVNRVIKTMLSMYVKENHRQWDVYLNSVTCAVRTLVHEVTRYTPYFLVFGREHVLSGKEFVSISIGEGVQYDRSEKIVNRKDSFKKLYDEVKTRLAHAYQRSSHQYNLRRRPVTYKVGQNVWRKNYALSSKVDYFAAKLSPKYIGPFKIKRKVGVCTYELADNFGNVKGIWHAKDLRLGPEEKLE